MNTRILLALVSALVLAMLLPLVLCGTEPTPEEAVRTVIRRTAEACEERRLGDAMEGISERYRDQDGLDKQLLFGLLFREFARDGRLGVVLGPIQVEVAKERARASFVAAFGESAGLLSLPEEADALQFELDLALEEGDWRITWHSRVPVFGG